MGRRRSDIDETSVAGLVKLVGFSDEVAEFLEHGGVGEKVGPVGLSLIRPGYLEEVPPETYEFPTSG